MFGRMKDPVDGTAMLISYELTNAFNEHEVTVLAHVVVEGPGLPPTAVDFFPAIRRQDLPLAPGTVWRARVDRRKPKRIKLGRRLRAVRQPSAAGQPG